MHWFKRLLKISYWSLISLAVIAFIGIGLTIFYLEDDLPDVSVLNDVQLQVPLRVYTSDGELIAEYGEKKRMPVPYEDIPPQLIHAVLATEDQRFFEHPGVDIMGLARAAIQVIASGNKVQGGSTITMQVARNFFLTRKKTYTRKLKEILLAIKIDNELSKEKIISLYLNKIYLGNRAYGVGAAAHVYYGKNLSELTLAQMAMIAGLPKAPSTLNPLRNPEAAIKRRNHVLNRMLEQNYITEAEYEEAVSHPLTAKYHQPPITVSAPYVAEMVRNLMLEQFGEEAYTSGLNVYTTIHSHAINAANSAVRNALIAYDIRHGYRGAVTNWGTPNLADLETWLTKLKQYPTVNQLAPAAVVKVDANAIAVIKEDGNIVTIDWDGLKWARRSLANGKYRSKAPLSAADVASLGDVIYIDALGQDRYRLAQVPEVEIALVAMNPQSGAIEALVGGFDFNSSNFNRVTQAKRQPGSSFKPFIYSAALNKGYTLASLINDAPIVINDPTTTSHWRPQNVNQRFYGPTRLRVGLTKSRNLVSIRLLEAVGVNYTVNYLKNYGFDLQDMPRNLSLALGSAAVTPLEMARAYSIVANGGFKVTPYLVNYITNDKNEVIYQAKPKLACEPCIVHDKETFLEATQISTDTYAEQAISPQVAYLMNSALKDVITHGTGRGVRQAGLTRTDLAGKTGTTNDQKDAWFTGFNSDIVTIVWLGYDQPRSLHEYAANAALPGWTEFMKNALANKPEHHMPQPPGIVSVRINTETGKLASHWDQNSVFEYFTESTVPTQTDSYSRAMDDNPSYPNLPETTSTYQNRHSRHKPQPSSTDNDERLF